MSPRQYIDRSQPQTLQTAVMLMYINAVMGFLFGVILNRRTTWWLLTLVLMAPAGFYVANEKKRAYFAAVALSVIAVGIILWLLVQIRTGSLVLNLLFAVGLVGLLVHPMSRSYVRIYFR